MSKKVFIIAEAGVNHNGSLQIAKKLIDVAANSGADAVKFQTFKAELATSQFAPKAEYQKEHSCKTETQLEMLKKLQLSIDEHKKLKKYCQQKKIIFLSSPFDIKSIDLLDRLGLEVIKIPSGEITNLPYLNKIGGLNKMVILSTGMSDLREIKQALDILTSAGTKKENITVLHCTTQYPAPSKDVNLRAMLAIKERFKVNVGYSDHTQGIEVPIAACALGASVIEKHFTLDSEMPGPDHKASLEPTELKAMVRAIRNIERALGNGIKKPTRDEEKIKKVVRKSIVAKVDITRGKRITNNMLEIKRPGTGIEPKYFNKVIGKKAKRDIKKDTLVKFKDLI